MSFINKLKYKFKHGKAQFFFNDSRNYWIDRYANGGNSGSGSYGDLAEFKAEIINDLVIKHNIKSVIEFGCGDGNQLMSAVYSEYVGFDVSPDAIMQCRKKYKYDTTKDFRTIAEYDGETADLSLSLDVIYHLVEDHVFEDYMMKLFNASKRYVIIYSSNTEKPISGKSNYIKHRKFTNWIESHIENWKLIKQIPNKYPFDGNWRETSFADFYFYKRSI